MNRDIIALAIVNAGLTYSIEDNPIYMREKPLDEVVDAVLSAIESVTHATA